MAPALCSLGNHRVNPPGSHLLGVAGSSNGGDHHHPGILQLLDDGLARGLGEASYWYPRSNDVVHPAVDISGVSAQVHPERAVGGLGHCVDRLDHLVERQWRGGDDAQAAGIGGGRRQPSP